jgi:uncharacterized membrane protein YcaP (DUF421 family)
MNFVLLAQFRPVLRRTVGSICNIDLIAFVLIAEAAGKAMGGHDTLSDGPVLVATLIGWGCIINRLTYAVPLLVMRDGRLLRRDLRADLLTEDEPMRHLRLEDIEEPGRSRRRTSRATGSSPSPSTRRATDLVGPVRGRCPRT